MTPATEVEVLIVGAGAAGCLMAAALAAAGRRVHVIEAGPGWEQGDLISSQIWSRRLRAGPIATGGAQPVGAGFNLGRGYGGAAAHHYATWPRLHVEDFRMRMLYGEGLDWPIDYATLRPFYDRIQREVGIAGDAKAEVWRPPGDPYPMPPHASNAQSRAIKRGFDKLGLRTAPAPMAINSIEYDGRPPCLYDGWCDAGCPIGALANPLVTYKPRAETAGATFEALTPALRVAAKGGRVEGVAVGGAAARFIRADVVVLAASVPHNPALLLASGIGGAAVGRYVMTHPAAQVMALFDDVETEPHLGLTGAVLLGQDGYRKDAEVGFVGGHQWLIAPSIKPNDLAGLANTRPDLMGAALPPFMARAAKHAGNMIGMAEALPDVDNRVTLAAGGADEPPRPMMTHKHRPGAQRAWERMAAEGVRVMRAGGAAEAWHGPQFSAHLMGGTVMGASAAESVCDSYGRVWGADNLFVAGPGLFPTGGAANPTLTALALALRAAEHVAGQWGRV